MSLLIEALRKAEQAKRNAQQAATGETAPAAAPASAADPVAVPAQRRPRALSAADLDALRAADEAWSLLRNDARAAGRPTERPDARVDAEAAARDSARLLFDAKTAPTGSHALRRIAAFSAVLGLVVAAYVWWEIQPRGGVGALPPTAAPAPRPTSDSAGSVTTRPMNRPDGAPSRPQDTASSPLQTAEGTGALARTENEPHSATQTGARQTGALPAAFAHPASPQGVALVAAEGAAGPQPAAAAIPSRGAVAAPAATRDTGVIPPPSAAPAGTSPNSTTPTPHPATASAPRATAVPSATVPGDAPMLTPGLGPIHRGSAPAEPPAPLRAAYAAYRAGQLAEARELYRKALARFPNSRDALDGLGAIALREGRHDEAGQWFRRALELDPDDPVAVAGLASLASARAPLDSESRLKQVLAANPDAAAAHFALGNALAHQQRWSEAQQAYFRAYTLEADNPDYLFNLAVSLDHLNQGTLARRFYDEALTAAAKRPAAFDPAAARARLEALR